MSRTSLSFRAAGFWAAAAFFVIFTPSARSEAIEYKVLATNKTSTMQKELNEAAQAGFRFDGIMGGDTAWGGSEAVVLMSRRPGTAPGRYLYRLQAANRTSTIEKEMRQLGQEGFEYKGQSIFKSTFGGKEVVVVMEKDTGSPAKRFDYRLLATTRTGTMQKELEPAGAGGFQFRGLTVAETMMGGKELVVILSKVEGE